MEKEDDMHMVTSLMPGSEKFYRVFFSANYFTAAYPPNDVDIGEALAGLTPPVSLPAVVEIESLIHIGCGFFIHNSYRFIWLHDSQTSAC